MSASIVEHETTLWMRDDIPDRMVFEGRQWRVTDTPTRLRESVWTVEAEGIGKFGWRFQATDSRGDSRVFDVIKTEAGWRVQRTYQ